MIWSFFLSVVLLVIATLGWGLVFSPDAARRSRPYVFSSLAFASATSIVAAIFFGEGLTSAGGVFTLPVSSVVFAAVFGIAMIGGFGLSVYSGTSGLFSYASKFMKSEEWNERDDRADFIEDILDRSVESGKIDSLERELIEGILKFNDKIVREVMIPRGDIVALNIDEEPRRVLRKVIEEGYSRMPVYRESIDNVVGIIYAKDLLTMVEDGAAIVLQDLLRAPYYVPESKKISQLLREMQLNKIHLAVVVDEFGGTEGIVTLEDVLEEIVGEIQDEYDESLSELVRDDNGDVHFSGSMTVERFNELLDADIPREDDYDTMAGFVQKLAGKLPQKNEVYNYEEMYFYVEEVARHRIKRLRVSYKEHPSLPEGFASEAPTSERPHEATAEQEVAAENVTAAGSEKDEKGKLKRNLNVKQVKRGKRQPKSGPRPSKVGAPRRKSSDDNGVGISRKAENKKH
ncbi:MAG: hemolysin family protein [Bacteroidetes bacterium]|nr:hemolysin family protein [Bacteroidota bacterium]